MALIADRGLLTITPDTSGVNKAVRVNFVAGRFSRTPAVVCNAQSISTNTTFARATAVDKDGFTFNLLRTGLTATVCNWVAIDVSTDADMPIS